MQSEFPQWPSDSEKLHSVILYYNFIFLWLFYVLPYIPDTKFDNEFITSF